MTTIIAFLLDLRDFAYVHYSKRYGKVSAKSWSGYRLLFTCLFLAYYILGFTIFTRIIPHDELFYNLKSYHPFIYYICFSVMFFSPLLIACHWVLKKLEIIQPLYYKSASSDYSRKEWRGWTTLVFGWVLFFLFFWILNHIN